VLPFNCFTGPGDPSTCEDRLTWLVEHGYEIGNHTRDHQNLSLADDELIKEEILEPVAWFAERIEGPGNLSDVLVLPFGMYPSEDYQEEWLFDGFWHHGEFFVPRLVLEVTGGPTRSPFHTEWTPNLTRINTYPDTFEYWTEQIESGEVEIFVSDGDPSYVTIPDGWEARISEAILTEDGREVLVQPPESASS
jgi:peptidoglycan/xylan/chitin deacetylase (PgdA/CDA1 family)